MAANTDDNNEKTAVFVCLFVLKECIMSCWFVFLWQILLFFIARESERRKIIKLYSAFDFLKMQKKKQNQPVSSYNYSPQFQTSIVRPSNQTILNKFSVIISATLPGRPFLEFKHLCMKNRFTTSGLILFSFNFHFAAFTILFPFSIVFVELQIVIFSHIWSLFHSIFKVSGLLCYLRSPVK